MYKTDKKILSDIQNFMNLKLPIINNRLNEIKLAKLEFFVDQEEGSHISASQGFNSGGSQNFGGGNLSKMMI